MAADELASGGIGFLLYGMRNYWRRRKGLISCTLQRHGRGIFLAQQGGAAGVLGGAVLRSPSPVRDGKAGFSRRQAYIRMAAHNSAPNSNEWPSSVKPSRCT